MVAFLGAVVILIVGYFTYGKLVERIFGVDETIPTPACRMADGVDYVPMNWKRIFLIQFLNIAGLGPIFGAISGALWGPVAYVWIVLGSIFAGGVHDFFSGMLSVRHDGGSISEIVGIYLGKSAMQVMRIFTVVLLVLVGTVFMVGPAKLLATLTPAISTDTWLYIIITYYFLATILPVDKVIGKLYPLFGASLLLMGVLIISGLIFRGYALPEFTLANLHPKDLPIWPLLFVTIACGAISGFHATQSPMMARCLENEIYGRKVFYGAMIVEGIIALIWAAAAIAFFRGTGELSAVIDQGGQGAVVNTISTSLLGALGGVLAILGVIAAPITSGDTAFRSARLTLADIFNLKQKEILPRLLIAVPLLIVAFIISRVDYNVIWRYFAWSNQTLATVVLWTGAVYLKIKKKNYWIAMVPATFMTAVAVTYILQAPEGFSLSTTITYPVGVLAAACALFFALKHKTE